MRIVKGFLTLALVSILLGGCAWTKSGMETNREYDIDLSITNQDQGIVVIWTDLDAQTDTDTETLSGDAPAEASPDTAIGYGTEQGQGAAATKGSSVIKDIENWMKKWMDNRKTENNTAPQQPILDPLEPGATPDTPSVGDNGGSDLGVLDPSPFNLEDYEVIAEAMCDSTMSYRHEGGPSVEQKKCVFDKPGTEYEKSFVVVWSSGNYLEIPDSGKMAWDTQDFRKYQPQEPIEGGGFVEGTPAEVYAGREDDSERALILVKKKVTPEGSGNSSDGEVTLTMHTMTEHGGLR